jgi:hypothetical protein
MASEAYERAAELAARARARVLLLRDLLAAAEAAEDRALADLAEQESRPGIPAGPPKRAGDRAYLTALAELPRDYGRAEHLAVIAESAAYLALHGSGRWQ